MPVRNLEIGEMTKEQLIDAILRVNRRIRETEDSLEYARLARMEYGRRLLEIERKEDMG